VASRFLICMLVTAAVGLAGASAGCGGGNTSGEGSNGGGSGGAAGAGASTEGSTSDGQPPGEAQRSGGAGTNAAAEGLASAAPDAKTYKRRAIAVCGKEGQRILAALESEPSKAKPGEFEVPASQELADSVLIPSVEEELGELRALGAPAGEQKRIEGMLAALQQGIEKDKEIEITSLADFGRGFERFDELARLYNLGGCIFGLS
jgi:hypothetical protein